MKELEVELEQLRQLVVAMVGREVLDFASGSRGGTVDDKVGEDERDARESSPQPRRRLRGGKVTGRKETRRKKWEGRQLEQRIWEWGRGDESEGDGSEGDRSEGDGSAR